MVSFSQGQYITEIKPDATAGVHGSEQCAKNIWLPVGKDQENHKSGGSFYVIFSTLESILILRARIKTQSIQM